MRSKRVVDPETLARLANYLGELSMVLIKEKSIDSQPSTTTLVYFSGVLGILPDGKTWAGPRNYTSHLSALIYCMRLLVLEWTLPQFPHPSEAWPPQPRSNYISALNAVHCYTLCYSVSTLGGELLSLCAFGQSISYSEGPIFRFF